MSLNDLMARDLTNVFFNTNDFAQVASLSRLAVTITPDVILDSQEIKTRDKNSVEISRIWVIVMVPVSAYDFGSGLVKPEPIDEFTVAGRTYKPRKVEGIGRCWEYTDSQSDIFKVFVEEV